MDRTPVRRTDRRTVLKTLAGVAASSTVALAGCDGNGGGGPPPSLSVDDYPAVDDWLTESEVGGSDDSYDGSIVDERDADEVTVDVGAEGNGGNLAFDPSAVAVSPGATVRWVWTGEGGLHNVAAAPDEQIGESDFEFRSGDPTEEEGTEYTQSFEETGVALYNCEPHIGSGMKGAVVVAETDEATGTDGGTPTGT